MKKLGLDVSKVKYVMLSHSHGIGDHDGGAKMFQDRVPGVKLVMAAADWDAMERGTSGYPKGKPKRDVEAADGQKITVGDTTITIITTPGHTPGTLSYIFNVKDRGQLVTVAYTGGTALNFGSNAAYYDTYIASAQKMGKAALDAKATVFLSNHSEFDNGYYRAKAVLARGPEDANAFIVGQQAVQDYYKMAADCAMAGKLRAAAATPVR
jgi:metallo-beta-lactamase class B